jgi:hypothetical protein
MEKIDFKKQLKHMYRPSAKTVVKVEVPPMNYLMIDGQGDPNTSQSFSDAIEALFALSYTIKFAIKKSDLAIDYGVMPLEGLWWTDDMSQFNLDDKSGWKWTLMVMQPEFVKQARIKNAIEQVEKKKNPTALSDIRFETYHEGLCAQIMHIGPFSQEGATVDKIHQFIEQNGFERTGKHHEIYLSDIRKADPKNWKTVIRQPMR